MRLNIIIFKNKKVNCFTQPQFQDIEPEKAAIQLSRSLLLNENPVIDKQYHDLDMYVIGEFDDTTGEMVPCQARKLLDCTKVIDSRPEEPVKKVSEEVVENGKEA